MEKINSIFIASLIYNPRDFKMMQKKNPDSELWSKLTLHDNNLMKIPESDFNIFTQIFKAAFPDNEIYFDFQ